MTDQLLTVEADGHRWRMYDPGQHIGRIIAMSGQPYELGVLRQMAAAYQAQDQAGGVVIDVGAHVGNHTLFMAAVCGAPVLAVEPSPVNYARLVRNVAVNETLAPLVTTLPIALGAAAGHASFADAHRDDITYGCAPAAPDPEGDIELHRLDDVMFTSGLAVSLVKIDVEGQEPAVIAGAGDTLDRWHPPVFAEARDDEAAAANVAALAPHGYRLTATLNRRRTPVQVFR